MKKIAVLGPNPAWQKTLFFEHFIRGAVNRAIRMEELASGKGINFCRALKCHGKAESLLIQFCGGENGSRIDAALAVEGMPFHSVAVPGKTRCCTTCLDETEQVMTELIEPSFPAPSEAVEALLERFAKELGNASGAAFCGSLPDGTDPQLYVRAAELAAQNGVLLLIDAFRDLDAVFAAGPRVVLKINREELAKLAGTEDTACGLRKIFARFPALKYAAITDGPGQAFAFDGRKFAVYTLPRLAKVANPIGCGDTASAVLLSELCAGNDLFEGFRRALAAASANCLNSKPGHFLPEEAAKLLPEMKFRN